MPLNSTVVGYLFSVAKFNMVGPEKGQCVSIGFVINYIDIAGNLSN